MINTSTLNKGLFVGLFLLVLALSFNRHNKAEPFTYHSEIWADRAGYYVHLPAFFIYGYDQKFPREYSNKTGNGFWFTEDEKVFSKYPVGVAILQSPFFLGANTYASWSSYNKDGFSKPYRKSIILSACVYGFIGLWLMFLVLKRNNSHEVSFMSLMCLLLGTNLFHYIYDDPGMSHVYSFFLFSFLFYLGDKKTNSISSYILIGFVLGLIFITRSINILFTPFVFLLTNKFDDLLTKIKTIKTVIALAFFCLAISPQLIYNYFITNKITLNLYKGEGFPYLLNPKIFQTWFAADNGLFIYTPIYLIIIVGAFFLLKDHNQRKLASVILMIFFILSYIYSSWWSTNLGCGFGHRGFVEFGTFFVLVMPPLFTKVKANKAFKPILLLVLILIILNIYHTYRYDECFYGKDTWDYHQVYKVLM